MSLLSAAPALWTPWTVPSRPSGNAPETCTQTDDDREKFLYDGNCFCKGNPHTITSSPDGAIRGGGDQFVCPSCGGVQLDMLVAEINNNNHHHKNTTTIITAPTFSSDNSSTTENESVTSSLTTETATPTAPPRSTVSDMVSAGVAEKHLVQPAGERRYKPPSNVMSYELVPHQRTSKQRQRQRKATTTPPVASHLQLQQKRAWAGVAAREFDRAA